MDIIALSGRPNSGKDTVANYIARYPRCYHLKCAHPLQDLTAYMIGLYDTELCHRALFSNNLWKDEQYYEINGKAYTPRQIQKILGHSLREQFGQDLFASMLMSTIASIPDYDNTIVVVSDVRRPQEVWALGKHPGTKFVYIYRDETDRIALESEEHQNETEAYHDILQQVSDYEIKNNGSINDLLYQVDNIYQEVRFGKSQE